MGAASSNHRHIAGRLILNPATLTPAITGANCGGTRLGTVQRLAFRAVPRIDLVTGQEYGSEAVDGVLLGHDLLLEGVFFGWDADHVQAILYGSSAGAGSVPLVSYPASEEGDLIEGSGMANTLLWIANNETAEPSFIYRRAVPWEISKPIFTAGRQPMAIYASWLLLRDASGRRFASGLLSELAL